MYETSVSRSGISTAPLAKNAVSPPESARSFAGITANAVTSSSPSGMIQPVWKIA
jgi:hypothetical protein